MLGFILYNAKDSCSKTVSYLKTKHEADLFTIELKAKEHFEKEVEKVREYERKQNEKTVRSLEKAKQREIELSNHIRNTDATVDRLHNTIRDLNTRVSNSSREAESRLRIAQQVSLEECSNALTEMESDANRLANTIREFDERWPNQIKE